MAAADLVLKFLLVGDRGIGKTQILIRYTEDAFTTPFISTIGKSTHTGILYVQLNRTSIQLVTDHSTTCGDMVLHDLGNDRAVLHITMMCVATSN